MNRPTEQIATTGTEARAAGLRTYFTGKPCKRGHVCERWAASGNCVECQRAAITRWYHKNKEELKPKRAAHYQQNKQALHARHVEWKRNNPEKAREYERKWKAKNRSAASAARQLWREKNRERDQHNQRQWIAKNRDKLAAIDHARRLRIKSSASHFTAADIAELERLQRHKCAACKNDLRRTGRNIDHVKPLARNGSNDKYNIQLLCPPCNRRKSAKDPIAWAQENGRLL